MDIPLGQMTVVTGVSGSGKSSLAFDTIYAEGQRRYVETFSPYARQFLDRMDRPRVKQISNVPPAIAINQVNPVRTSRSTVGTMTELNDHLKLLFARSSSLFCSECGDEVSEHSEQDICALIIDQYQAESNSPTVQVMFAIELSDKVSTEFAADHLERQGYKHLGGRTGNLLLVVQDRLRPTEENQSRLFEAIEVALVKGKGEVLVQALDKKRSPVGEVTKFSNRLHCSKCDIDYALPTSNTFSFNSPVGACETCRGFGRIMDIDYDLVIPNDELSLYDGAIRPYRFDSISNNQNWFFMIDCANAQGIPVTVPWKNLTDEQIKWVIEGEADFNDEWDEKWHGIKRYFEWQESRQHLMHVRVHLSKYRGFTVCAECGGSRLKPDGLRWRLNSTVPHNYNKFRYPRYGISEEAFTKLPGLAIHDVAMLPISDCREFFETYKLKGTHDEATLLLLDEILSRLRYLVDVGLGYLNLNRQSRTLSGGEVQRINLTTALGTTLVNTLFVLDEPTIGLHARDVGKVIGILHRLRNAGNSLIVVEHDEQVIRSSEQVLDLGPGPGESGGEIVYYGRFKNFLDCDRSVTARCLKDRNYLPKFDRVEVLESTPQINLRGVNHNNINNMDVDIPMGRLVCVTGVSGSGKSSLIEEVLYFGTLREFGRPTEPPGKYDSLEVGLWVDNAVMVDQSSIGKSTRSVPVTYIGALTPIRERFAAEPLAKKRGMTAGYFSFNSNLGRCPQCEGTGFEYIEMQFLSDVYLRCSECDGARFRPEVLEIRTSPANGSSGTEKSIAEILDLTITEAIDFFSDDEKIVRLFWPLQEVGLDYLKLGQPIPTLSGGEAQRLKLSMHIVESRKISRKRRRKGHTIYMFDEPTTGLHFTDVSKLISAMRALVDKGHSVIVIEHNFDLISCADWLIDLGPNGGSDGGKVIDQGTPSDIALRQVGHTGRELQKYYLSDGANLSFQPEVPLLQAYENTNIQIRNAREHNLKNISVSIPYEKITAITGLSGSGKSTVAFDILHKEGQKRYLETLNAYSRQYVQPATRADFDAVSGLPATVAIEQRISRGGNKSTVATLTELYHFIRLLYSRFGVQYCPDCQVKVESETVDTIVDRISEKFVGKTILILAPLIVARTGYYTELAKWANSKGVQHLLVDDEWLITSDWPRLDRYQLHDIDIPVGNLQVTADVSENLRVAVREAIRLTDGFFKVGEYKEGQNMRKFEFEAYSATRACPICSRAFQELDPRQFSFNSSRGWCQECQGTGIIESEDDNDTSNSYTKDNQCKVCKGKRLAPESLFVRFKELSIDELGAMSIEDAKGYFSGLELTGRERIIAKDIFSEILSRLNFLLLLGLGYLGLDRAAPSLSGGETQRIRLAAQLGSSLSGACYILDEPTIGLHPVDNKRLISALQALKNKGNTIVVVEHDEETIVNADYVIDLGPGGGVRGGEVVAAGTIEELQNNPLSITGKMLSEPLVHPLRRNRNNFNKSSFVKINGASERNLKNIDVQIPLNALTCVTGLSGSGKSTLVREVLYENSKQLLSQTNLNKSKKKKYFGCKKIEGWDKFGRILEVDQTPIGRTPRSCPATYIDIWSAIRKLFAESPEANLRGYGPSRFSFNVAEGRCTECGGQGENKIEMSFLPNVRVLCEACYGNRFNSETLSVTFRGKNISEVLRMSMEEAMEHFSFMPSLHRVFQLLVDVGLGYLTLGQPSPTLSGGEAQRIKLVSELAKAIKNGNSSNSMGTGRSSLGTLYVLDEPTVGLHSSDVEKLLKVIHALVDSGNSVVVVEHNLDFIAEADWIIDLGPEGGDAGGRLVVEGALRTVMKSNESHTAEALRKFLADSRRIVH